MVDQIAVSGHADGIGAVYAALACSTRRVILERLAREGTQKVSDLARPFHITKQAITKHLKMLERAGLIRREIRGREHHCSLQAIPMAEAASWLEQYREIWESRFDSLDTYLAETQRETASDQDRSNMETA